MGTNDTIKVDVNKCQRCGIDHAGMQFKPLLNPADDFTYYGRCPLTGQPVLLAVRTAEWQSHKKD